MMNRLPGILWVLALAFLCGPLFAQSQPFGDEENAAEATSEDSTAPEPSPAAPGGFRNIRLGMSMEAAKEALAEDPLFAYRGDPDVSFIPVEEQRLIECAGNVFIDRAYFQFRDEKLLVMILQLDPREVSYYETFTALSGTYGDPTFLDPTQVVWELAGLRLSLERPLSVKYLDAQSYAEVQEASAESADYDLATRRRFLEQL